VPKQPPVMFQLVIARGTAPKQSQRRGADVRLPRPSTEVLTMTFPFRHCEGHSPEAISEEGAGVRLPRPSNEGPSITEKKR